jgi:hypothetical protein
MVSYLIAKGATGLATTDIKAKSCKELAIENRTKAEVIISKRSDTILDHETSNRAFLSAQMTYHLDMQSTQTEMK